MHINESLVQIHTKYLARCRSLTHLMKNNADVEDSIQDAYVRLLEAHVDGIEIRDPNAFTNRIARNIAIDHLRRGQRGQRIFVSANESDSLNWQWTNSASQEDNPEELLSVRQTMDSVLEVIAQLPEKCSRAYILNCIGNHSRSEIAQEIGVSVSMIEKYVRRARDHVQAECDLQTIFSH